MALESKFVKTWPSSTASPSSVRQRTDAPFNFAPFALGLQRAASVTQQGAKRYRRYIG